MADHGLYLHIPFCIQKCGYCDFISYAGREILIEEYLHTMQNELHMHSKAHAVDNIQTIFIGGGTPSLLTEAQVSTLLSAISKDFHIAEKAEITIEANPGTVSKEKLKGYMSAGINRLSLGFQSLDDGLLAEAGRIHSRQSCEEGYDMASCAGFRNINIDLMYGMPNQNIEAFTSTLQTTAALKPQHISCYSLILEADTLFYERHKRGELLLPDEDVVADMQETAISILRSFGYARYEISNYALPSFECRHNINYWQNGLYIGAGCAAHGCIRQGGRIVRYANTTDLEDYINRAARGVPQCGDMQEISADESAFESIMLGLRMTVGIDKKHFFKKHGKMPEYFMKSCMKRLAEKGLLINEDSRIYLTEKGLDLQNTVLAEILEEFNYERKEG